MAYKTFANGFPLPASDLNNYLMNQSVIVFADSTARTAALPTPTEGMVTYLEDTNLLEVYNGSAWVDINDNTAAIPKSTVTTAGDLIVADGASSVTRLGAGADGSLLTVDTGSPAYLAPGTDDQVLTLVSGAPAWADAGGAGGETLITSQTETGFSGSITFSSIPQTYKDLKVILKFSGASTNNLDLYFYDNLSANAYVFLGVSGTGASSAKLEMKYKPANSSAFALHLFDYSSSNITPFLFSNAFDAGFGISDNFAGGGNNRAAGSINAIEFTLSGATDVTIELYGVN